MGNKSGRRGYESKHVAAATDGAEEAEEGLEACDEETLADLISRPLQTGGEKVILGKIYSFLICRKRDPTGEKSLEVARKMAPKLLKKGQVADYAAETLPEDRAAVLKRAEFLAFFGKCLVEINRKNYNQGVRNELAKLARLFGCKLAR